MRRLLAFAVAFLATLFVALVPLAVSDLSRTEAQLSGNVEPPELTVPNYRYQVLPGAQAELDSVLYLRMQGGTKVYEADNRPLQQDHENIPEQRTDMFIWMDPHFTENLPAGTYTIEATTKAAEQVGLFALTISISDTSMGPVILNPGNLCETELTELGTTSKFVRVYGRWRSGCESSHPDRVGNYAKYYTFTLANRATVTIDLAGRIDPVLEPTEITLTCGWHIQCAGTVNQTKRGIDMDTVTGDSVYMVFRSESESRTRLVAEPTYLQRSALGERGDDGSCRTVAVEVVTEGGRRLAYFRYKHVWVPGETLEIADLPRIPILQSAASITMVKIGEVARPSWKKVGEDWEPLTEMERDAGTDNSACPNYGDHLHQGGEYDEFPRMFRNIDSSVDACAGHTDTLGFPTRKYDRYLDANGNCRTRTTLDKKGNTVLAVYEGGGCFWSDMWLFKIQVSATPPEPSDRNVDGPSEIYGNCPTRTLTLSASDQGGEVSPEPPAPSDPDLTYRPGIAVTLTATPSADYYTHWTERGGIDIKDDSVVVTMDKDRTIRANFVPHGTLAHLGIASGNSISVQFKSRHAARFELYTSSGSICIPGTSGCTLAATVTKGAVATDAERTASFGDHPSGKYWVRGQYCASGSASAPGVATDACGKWSDIFGPRTYTAAQKYRLTVRANPASCGSASGAGDYAEGSAAPISASAGTGCRFKNWTGAGIANASSSSTTVTMGAADKTVTANFTKECKLTVKVTPSGGGTTTPAARSLPYTYNPCRSSVSLSASASTGYRFDSWSGGVANASSSSTTIAMSAGDDKTVTARFVPEYTLTIKISPSDCGSASGEGDYVAGKAVPISATANAGCLFDEWDGAGIANASSSSTTVTMGAADKTVTANFTKECKLTVKVTPSGGGTATPAGTRVHNPCPENIPLRAYPSAGYRFDEWDGSGIANTAPRITSVSMRPGDRKTVTAGFESWCILTVRVSPSGGGTTTPSGTRYRSPCPDNIPLGATANTGYLFDEWTGSGIANTASRTTSVSMRPGDRKTVTAGFKSWCILTVRVSPSGGGTTTPSAGTHVDRPCKSSVSLSATANAGYRFVRWDGASGTSASTSVAMRPGDRKTVTARFAKQCTLTVTAGPGGTVRGGGTFDCYAWRTVRAIPNDYHYLKRWDGDSRTSSSLRVYLFRNRITLRAVFDHVCNHPVYGVFCPVAGAAEESGAEP